MDTLVASHPNLISKINIGNSYESRPMYALKVQSERADLMIANRCVRFFHVVVLIPVQHRWCEPTRDLDWCWYSCQRVGDSGFCSVDRQQGEWDEWKMLKLFSYCELIVFFSLKMALDYGVDPSVTSLLGQMDVYLMIVTNPDGYAFTHTDVGRQKLFDLIIWFIYFLIITPAFRLST